MSIVIGLWIQGLIDLAKLGLLAWLVRRLFALARRHRKPCSSVPPQPDPALG